MPPRKAQPPDGARRPAPPLDEAMLMAMAVRYVERFQTSRARLVRHLGTRLRQRGWPEDQAMPDVEAVADRMVMLGYVDDRAYADARARGLARRGLGERRIRAALDAGGIAPDDQADALAAHDPLASAIAFARRKRLGPFGPMPIDRDQRQRQFAAMVRAGHAPSLVAAIVGARTIEDLPQADDCR